ncbi:hypothetical protein ACFQ3Z_45610 [Streptomyces nogalater]
MTRSPELTPRSRPVQSNDNTRQDRQELVYLPVPFPKAPPEEPRFAALRAWWKETWDEGGVLHEMWDDVLSAPGAAFGTWRPGCAPS